MKLFKRRSARSLHSSHEIKNDVFIKSAQASSESNTGHLDNLQEEAEELKRCLEKNIRTPHVFPVEFISYDKTTNRLATKFISNGTSLFNVMWNSSSFLNRIQKRPPSRDIIISRCEEIGQWLARYHQSTSYPHLKDQVIHVLKDLFEAKIEANRKNHLLQEKFLRNVKDVFFSEIEKLADDSYLEQNQIRICKIHADFTPVNMLSDDSWNIQILDFAEARIGTSFEDVGRFYEILYGIAQMSGYRKKMFSIAMESFIKGYGLSPESMAVNPFFLTVRAYNTILNSFATFTQRRYLSFASNLAARRMTNASLIWLSKQLAIPF